jgi:hypothetical protein
MSKNAIHGNDKNEQFEKLLKAQKFSDFNSR